MSITEISQFHENTLIISWWHKRLFWVLEWMTTSRRRLILATGAVWVGIQYPLRILHKYETLPIPHEAGGIALVVLALFSLLGLTYYAASRFSSWHPMVRNHPQLTLHLLYWGMLAVLWMTTPVHGLWRAVLLGVALIFPYLLWRCGYMLLAGQYGRMTGTRFWDHLFTLWPPYGGSNTPYGKGLVYLSRCEAKDSKELARSQLAGIKLLLLCQAWRIVMWGMDGLVYGESNGLTDAVGGYSLAIPRLAELLSQGGNAPIIAAWGSVYSELVHQVLHHAVRGHELIGILRLLGFNVFRNTYKPLLAESVVEFWNRYFYYFKELLTNFFFLPVFAKTGSILRHHPQLRMLLAVFAAAFFGNLYYHLLQDVKLLTFGDVFEALYDLRSKAFYCFLLAAGIYVSMLREQRRGNLPQRATVYSRWLRRAGVWTFFALIIIWDARGNTPFLTRLDFFLGLFGLA